MFVIAFFMIIGINSAHFYIHWYLKNTLLVLSLMTILKQQFIKHINGKYQRNNHKKSNILSFDGIIKIKDFNTDLLTIDKTSYKNIDIYYIGYIIMKDFYYVKFNSVNPLYLIIGKVDGYIE